MHSLWIATWLLWLAPAEARPSADVDGTHRVERGDNLWTIARTHGCDVDQLRRANPQLKGTLRIGAVLEVPRCDSAAPTPKAEATPKATAAPVAAAPAGTRLHHVKPGETLAGIAKRHRIPVAEIMRRNKLRSTTILVGRDLDVGNVPAPVVRRPTPPAETRVRGRTLPSIVDDVTEELPGPRAPETASDVDDELPEDEADEAAGPVAFGSARGSKGARGQSIGKTNHGKLVGGVQLPKDSAYHRRHPKRAFGATNTVELTRAAIAEVRRKHPRVHKLAIGDISDPDGGRLSGHRSHQSGRDVDIGLYFKRTPKNYPERFVGADEAPLHIAATWTLVDAFYRQSKRAGGPVAIFLDYGLQKRLVEYGRKHGTDKRVLREMFQYPGGRRSRTGFVRHEPGHDDHLHVRFGCPPRDRACG